jgi:hypothetical protein
MRAVWVGLVLVLGCSATGPVPDRKAPVAVAAAPAAPVAPDERDLLWALAPEGATLGVVVSPRGVAMIERAVTTAQDVLTSSADFAALQAEVMHGLMRAFGTPSPTLAGFGLSHDKGFALFVVDRGQVVMVLPVGDRDRFVAAMEGSKGADGDVAGSWACQTSGGRYVCAQRRGLLAKLGRGGLDAVRRSAAARGEIEIAGRGMIEPLGRSFAAVAELDRGAVVLRGTVEAASLVTDLLGAPGRPRADAAAAAGFGVVDLTPVIAALRPVPIAPGVTIADLARTISGPVTYVVGAGTADPGIHIPLRDPGPARALVEHCDALRPLAQFGATVRDGACRVPVPGSRLVIESWIDGGELRIANRAAGAASAIAPSPLARELAQGAWSLALFGRGSFFDLREARSQMAPLPAWADSALRVWPLISEAGLGIRKDGASVHFVVGARTIWSNPDDVVRRLLAIPSGDLLSGKAIEAGASIASAAPASPFAHDLRAGLAGFMSLSVSLGMLVGIGTPAWADHSKPPN